MLVRVNVQMEPRCGSSGVVAPTTLPRCRSPTCHGPPMERRYSSSLPTAIYIVRDDGSDVRTLAGNDRRGFLVGSAPWAPSSSAPLRPGRGRFNWESVRAVWSPDGSMIALHGSDGGVDIVDRDGSNWRNLMWVGEDGAPHSVNAPVDRAVCAAGVVVPEPEVKPGLVTDCRTLVGIWNYYDWDQLAWDTSTPITEWEGVVVGGSPPRVRELRLPPSLTYRGE